MATIPMQEFLLLLLVVLWPKTRTKDPAPMGACVNACSQQMQQMFIYPSTQNSGTNVDYPSRGKNMRSTRRQTRGRDRG